MLFAKGVLYFHFGRENRNVSIDLSHYGKMRVECTCGYPPSSTCDDNNNNNNNNNSSSKPTQQKQQLLCDHVWHSLRFISPSLSTDILDGEYIIRQLLSQDTNKLVTVVLNQVFQNNKLIPILEKHLKAMNCNGIRQRELPFELTITKDDVRMNCLFDEFCKRDEVIHPSFSLTLSSIYSSNGNNNNNNNRLMDGDASYFFGKIVSLEESAIMLYSSKSAGKICKSISSYYPIVFRLWFPSIHVSQRPTYLLLLH